MPVNEEAMALPLSVLLIIAFASSLGGQGVYPHKVSNGPDFVAIWDELVGAHGDLGKDTKFKMTLRYIPPGGTQFQISVEYDNRRTARATRRTLSRPLGTVIQEVTRKDGRSPTLADLHDRVRLRTVSSELRGELAREWLVELFKAIAVTAAATPERVLRSDEEIHLDPTEYSVQYSDAEMTCKWISLGPDPVRAASVEVAPLVRWMIGVSRRLDSLMTSQPK